MWRLFGEYIIQSNFPIIPKISNFLNEHGGLQEHGGVRGEARFPPGGKGGSALPPSGSPQIMWRRRGEFIIQSNFPIIPKIKIKNIF